MRIVYKRCCGMDVHKNSVTACVLRIDEDGEFEKQTRYFSTMTRDLKEMSGWLASLGVEAIAMEATGVYFTSSMCQDGRRTRRTASGLPSYYSTVFCGLALCRRWRSGSFAI